MMMKIKKMLQGKAEKKEGGIAMLKVKHPLVYESEV